MLLASTALMTPSVSYIRKNRAIFCLKVLKRKWTRRQIITSGWIPISRVHLDAVLRGLGFVFAGRVKYGTRVT